MKNILHALSKAKSEIKNTTLKKGGRNTYSNYEYWTPEQVEKLVHDACNSNGLITIFCLKRNEFGEYGQLEIYHIESSERIEMSMATAIPQITATNATQQLGGCMTYTERYLKMSAFGIHENDLDLDSKDNTKNDLPWLNPTDQKWKDAVSKKTDIKIVLQYFKMSKANQETYKQAIS
jgi:hypothetical protein